MGLHSIPEIASAGALTGEGLQGAAFWEALYRDSAALTEPCIVRGGASPLTFAHIASALHGATDGQGGANLNYFRGYIDGREDYTLPERFLSAFDGPDTDMAATIDQAFGNVQPRFGPRSGIVINGALQWSESVQLQLAAEAVHIARLYGSSTVTLDLTLFIGAYGATPFGAHVDDASHRTILFNLGPSTKGISIWDNDAVYAQFGYVNNVFDASTIEAPPTQFFFEAGDAFVLPSRQFHQGMNQQVSTTVALVVDLIGDAKAITREAHSLYADIDDGDGDLRSELLNLTAATLLRLYALRVKSNHFLRYPPRPLDVDLSAFKRATRLEKTAGFALESASVGRHGILFSRGRHMIMARPVDAGKCAAFLERATTAGQFVSHCCAEGMVVADALRLLRFLINSSSVRVVQ